MATTIEKQIWLIETIKRYGSLKFREINDKWMNSSELNPYEKPLKIRTFHDHVRYIKELYGITIKCNKSENSYYIDYDAHSSNEEIRSWLLDTISLDNMLREDRQIWDRILMAKIQTGQKFLPTIIDAMKKNVQLEFSYQRFSDENPYTTTISPYFIKAFRQRWYMIGITPRHVGELRTYALDRIRSIKITDIHYSYPKDFSPADYFDGSFGIYHSSEPVSRIIIKVFGIQRKYIRTLPLHQSQIEIESDDEKDYSVFLLNVRIDEDLIREILSNGDTFQIIEPEKLKNEIIKRLKKSLKNYEKIDKI